MTGLFECKELGEMDEYVGCKVERDLQQRTIKLTQPVLLQSYQDEFELDEHGLTPRMPAEAGSVLSKGEGNALSSSMHKKYRTGVGKLLHMTRWTRPDIQNSVRECSKMASFPTKPHLKAMKRAMKYCVTTPKRGLLLAPKGEWDGRKGYKFELVGFSDSEYAKDETRRSVNGWSVFMCEAPITYKSKMMPIVALSVTEAELFAAVQCAQDMMCAMCVLNGMGLQVKLPMILYIDNKGAKDFVNNWSVGGRTRHIEVKQYFLRELREAGIVECRWKSGDDMCADIFTKNCPGPLFEKHASKFVGVDCYFRGDAKAGTHKGRVSEVNCEDLGSGTHFDIESYDSYLNIMSSVVTSI
eukprot:15345960-Ditylum_brightwellii.AAC.1